MDRKKKLIPLFFTSAMTIFWACGEGNINYVEVDDEMAQKKMLEKIDSTKKDYDKNVEEFLQPFIDYCNSKEGHKNGCNADVAKVSSSSKSGDNKSASSTSSSSKGGNSNSSTSSSSKGGTSSSSGQTSNSSSSKTTNSSSSVASSSSKKLETAGKCVLTKPEVVYIGDEISWRYVPDEGTVQSAEFTWSFNDDEVEKSIVKGDKSGTGTPELKVKFSTKGTKVAPTLTFNGKGVECDDNVKVVAKDDPVSSSSEPESSSSEPESSSSSTPIAKGYCSVSKRKVLVGEEVDWFIVDIEGNELSGAAHQWQLRDASATLVAGDESGTGSTRITVTYSTPGSKAPTVSWNGKSMICDRNDLDEDDFDDLLVVETKSEPVSSSSSEEVIEDSSSSGEVEEKSSSSKAVNPCDVDPESCVF